MWACVAYFLFPLFWLVIASTKSNGDLFSTFGLWFGNSIELFKNIGNVFTYDGGIFLLWGYNTALYAGVSAVGAALLATAAGYGFAKYRFPGQKVIFSSVLGAVMIPATALAIPSYLLFASVGLTNTPLAVILPSIVSPFGVFLMRVYAADAIPDSLIEAARIDGASEFRIFWQVSLKLMAPGIVTVFLFALVATWNNYFLPLIMLTDAKLYPLTVGLAQWQEAGASGGGALALFSIVITGSFVSIIPLVIAFLYLQRFWQSGLSAGGVKG
ncbi:carbohydrate ABC transporter permease [Salinibacterium sp. UTAS2018]|uniref:carbohydrate ABC transporter permease n=1 Tax=unclassified Salinibacterium TaxID=2632331 RepID=UPI0010096456|nr:MULTISPECIES: carbohydrate ABC transporter permease [unclassified Salinibacterium]MBH0009101.1 carbohydrate ABC transporter permease [Salinibacterium sp. SWN1162]QAV71547.1 carbohydrate ABC transporter permease [Salinibacterium sp. UTAS2018]